MKGKIINLQLDDSFYKEEIRDGYTVTTKQKKIWAVEMDLLDQLLKVCKNCLLYTSPSPRDRSVSRMPSSA